VDFNSALSRSEAKLSAVGRDISGEPYWLQFDKFQIWNKRQEALNNSCDMGWAGFDVRMLPKTWEST
jgi:hypothetical protein